MTDRSVLFKAHSVARRMNSLREGRDAPPKSQSMSSVQRWLDYFANKGVDVDAIFREAQTLSRAVDDFEDELGTDSLLQCNIYRLLLQQLPIDPVLIESGAGITETYFRMMCYCILPCRDLVSALRRVSEYCQLLGEPVSQIGITVSQHAATLHLVQSRIPATEPLDLRLSTSMSAMAIWHQFIGWLIGERV